MNKSQKQRLILIVLGLSIAGIALYFSIDAFRDKASLFKSPEELVKIPPKERAGQSIRLGGLVTEGSVESLPEGGFSFVITDFQSDIKVHYNGLLPDLFREGQGVYIDGQFNEDGDIFIASQVLAKHDENYKPPLPDMEVE